MERFVENQLQASLNILGNAVTEDVAYTKTKVIPKTQDILSRIAVIFMGYVVALNKLISTYSIVVHPNKCPILVSLIEKTLGRIVELKHEMVEVDMSDFQFLNKIIISYQISRGEARLLIPPYYSADRKDFVKDRQKQRKLILEEKERREREIREEQERKERQERGSVAATPTPAEEEGKGSDEIIEEVQEEKPAETTVVRPKFEKVYVFPFIPEILLIQRHERARVGRLHVQRTRAEQKVALEKATRTFRPYPAKRAMRAALTIQEAWRKYRNSRKQKYNDIQNRIIYRMLKPSYREGCNEQDVMALREAKKKDHIKEMKIYTENMKKTLEQYSTPEIRANMLEEMRDWVQRWYECTRNFGWTELPIWPPTHRIPPQMTPFGIPQGISSDYYFKDLKNAVAEVTFEVPGAPMPELLGSELLSAGFWLPPEMYVLAAYEARHRQDIEKQEDLEKIQQEKEEKEREEAERIAELKRIGHIPTKSAYVSQVHYTYKDYIANYFPGRDLSLNPRQEHDEDRIKRDLVFEIRKKLRHEVDAQIREDLEVLEAAIIKDEGELKHTRAPGKKKKQEVEKKRKVWGVKKKKDPLAERDPDSLFDDLIEDGLVPEAEDWTFDSLPISYNHHGQGAKVLPLPSLCDVYEVANLYVTIPLCCQDIREKTTAVNSLLLVGPTLFTIPLVHAMANESGSVLFHLPAVDLECRYKDKLLIDVMYKVTRAYQPCIIHVDNVEKVFYSKVPPEEKTLNLSGLKTVLKRLVKGLKDTDRVVVVGTAQAPWLSKSTLLEVFDKVLPIQHPDFHYYSSLVQSTLMKYHGVDREFNTVVPANAFLGQPVPDMVDRLDSVFTRERILSLKKNPLDILELGCLEKEAPPEDPTSAWYNDNYSLPIARAEYFYELENPKLKAKK